MSPNTRGHRNGTDHRTNGQWQGPDGAIHRRFIDIFEFTAHRDAVSQTRHSDAERLDQLCQVKSRGISFDGKVRCYENFLNGALIQIIMAARVLYGLSAQGWLPPQLPV